MKTFPGFHPRFAALMQKRSRRFCHKLPGAICTAAGARWVRAMDGPECNPPHQFISRVAGIPDSFSWAMKTFPDFHPRLASLMQKRSRRFCHKLPGAICTAAGARRVRAMDGPECNPLFRFYWPRGRNFRLIQSDYPRPPKSINSSRKVNLPATTRYILVTV